MHRKESSQKLSQFSSAGVVVVPIYCFSYDKDVILKVISKIVECSYARGSKQEVSIESAK